MIDKLWQIFWGIIGLAICAAMLLGVLYDWIFCFGG